jgi:class 3 adenylate cyclase/tetratricopeptide (TPR) repeat protein
MDRLPSGIVTFLFTDIEGSMRLLQQHPGAMPDALARHHELLHDAIGFHHGCVFKIVGDAFCSVFERADSAAAAALCAQRALHRESWSGVDALRVRMGLHTGAAEPQDGEYASSLTLARAQRVMGAGHGGQILLSAATAERVRPTMPPGTTLRVLGSYKLRGLDEPETLFQLVAADLPSEFPPLRVEDAGTVPGAAALHELARGKLVGRTVELTRLKQHWDQAQQARGHLVLLSGEPGVGKTRLAQELIAHARQSGATLLRGGCYEYETTTPYLPLVEALREWVHGQGIEQLRAKLGTTAAEMAKLAPEIESRLGTLVPNAPLSVGEERLRLFDNFGRLLQALAADCGLLLFIDDLHWADRGTLSLLHYALRHLRNDRVLALATYRTVELDRTHPLAAVLVDWNRERLATRIALERLSQVDTGVLIAMLLGQETVSDEFVNALYRETEGNPFFLEEVLKSLIEQGQIYRQDGGWGRKETHELAIPQSVKEAIGRRLTRLTDAAVDMLRTAAALGKVFSFDELAAVTPGNIDALLDALDEAAAAQLVRSNGTKATAPSGGYDNFAFSHDKIREVLYEELNPIRQRRLHQRIGEALERLYGASTSPETAMTSRSDDRTQELAHHFTRAGDLERSLAYSRRAAGTAERVFAHDEALKFLEQARESAEALKRAEDLAAVVEQIGDIHEMRGVIHAAVDSYERALAAATTREARAALKVKLGKAYAPLGDPRGLARLEESLAELDPATQTNTLALATALVGRYYHYRTEHTRAIEFLDRAWQLAEPLHDPAILSNICMFQAGAHQHLMQYDKSDGWARVSIAIGEREQFPSAIAVGNEFLAENAAFRGLWGEALAFAALDAQEGRKIGSLARVGWGEFCRVQALHGMGELAKAYAAALEALALCEQIGEGRLATWLEPLTAQIAADLGDNAAALDHAERGWVRAGTLNQLLLSAWALHGLGQAAMMRDDIATALEWYEQYVTLVRDTENALARNLIIARAAETYLRAERIKEAAQLAEQAMTFAEFGNAPHYHALASRVQGQILLARGQPDDALRFFDTALAEFRRIGSRLEAGRVLYHRAMTQFARDEQDAGCADAELASDAFTAVGAVHDRARVKRLLMKGIRR